MDKRTTMEPPVVTGSPDVSQLTEQYGCGSVPLVGAHDSLYERHLLFDNVVDLAAIDLRQSFEALGAYAEHLHQRKAQAHLLPLDGVSHRPLPRQ